MFCENCGKEIPAGDKFCMQCGWKVPEELIAEEPKVVEPAVEEVKAEESKTEQPQTEQPQIEEVNGEKPGAEEPKTEAPKAEQISPAESMYAGYNTGAIPGMVQPTPSTASPEPKKKKFSFNSKIAVIVGAAAVAAVLIVALVVTCGDVLSNTLRKTFSSPEKYYQWVEKKTVKEAASSAADIYGSYLLESIKVYDSGVSGELTLELDDAGQDMLSLAGLAGVDLSWFKSATIYYEAYSKDNVMQNAIGFGLGKERLLTLDTIVDMEGENAYLAIPELSKTYIGAEMGDLSDYSYYIEDDTDGTDYMDMLKNICEKLPQEKQVQELLAKYFDIALGCVEDVDMKKGKSLRAEGITQTCTELEVTIDADTVEDILKAVLEEMEEDKDIKNIIVKLCDELAKQDLDGFDDIDAEDVYEEFQDACKAARKNAKYVADSDFELVMTLYVDNKGNVRGRTVEYDDGWDSFRIEVSNPHKGSSFGYKAAVSVEGQEIAVEGSGKDSSGTVDGEFSVKYNGTGIVDIAVNKFDTDSLKKGYLNGEFTMKASSGINRALGMASNIPVAGDVASLVSILNDMEVSLDVSMSENSNKLILGLAADDEKWGSISLSADRKAGKKASVPSAKNTIFVEDEDDFEDYWDTIEWDSFLKKLDKTDLPSDIVDIVEEIAEFDADEIMDEMDDILWDLMYNMY